MFAHYSPNYREVTNGKIFDLTASREGWASLVRFMNTTRTSKITELILADNKATVFLTSHELTRIKFPRFLSKMLITTDELYCSEWVKVSDVWLCETADHLKTRFRGMKWQKPDIS